MNPNIIANIIKSRIRVGLKGFIGEPISNTTRRDIQEVIINDPIVNRIIESITYNQKSSSFEIKLDVQNPSLVHIRFNTPLIRYY